MDVLALLRQYVSRGQKYKVTSDSVVFDGVSFPKDTKTKFIIYGTGRDGQEKEYYSIGTVVYLLDNVDLNHVAYVQAATADKISHVRRPDRMDLLTYLRGEVNTVASIDQRALPIRTDQPVFTGNNSNPVNQHESPRGDATNSSMKNAATLSPAAQKIANKTSAEPNIRPLSDKLPKEVVQQLRAKALAKRRNRIVESEGQEAVFVPPSSEHTDLAQDLSERERVWRNRTLILQSVTKAFTQSVDAILSSVKAREEGRFRGSDSVIQQLSKEAKGFNGRMQVSQSTGYSRYDQEKFGSRDETDDFEIDIHGTYHGMSLKSVTEGAVAKKPKIIQPIRTQVLDKPKRVSRTPIIVIPAGVVSTITMLNVKDVLQDLRFVPNDVKRQEGSKRDAEMLLQRKKDDGTTVPFRVVDNISKLTPDDWTDRVVAVFCQGPAWQFKGWPWGGNPIDIFQKVIAFHLKLSGTKTDQNIARWNVNVIELDQHKRHLDRARLLTFWEKLDRFIAENKSHLRH